MQVEPSRQLLPIGRVEQLQQKLVRQREAIKSLKEQRNKWRREAERLRTRA